MRRRGRPVLGAISGLLFGVFAAIDLAMFKIHELDNLSVIGLPAIGLLLGILLGVIAPFGKREKAAMEPATVPASEPAPAPPPGPAESAEPAEPPSSDEN